MKITATQTVRPRSNGNYLYIPSNLETSKVLPANLIRYADCANWLIHLVVRGRVLNQANEYGFVPVKVAYLRKVTPLRVERELRTAVLDAGILECDGYYIKGEKAMGYRLTEQYRVPAKRVECHDKRVERRVDELRDTMYRTDTKLPVHKHLRDWLKRLEIDRERARKVVLSTPHLAKNADIHLTAIDMIRSGHVEFSYCRNGRVHSLVTRLAREIREHLRIKNQPLVNIDITNSQPLILCLTLPHTRPTTPHPTNTPTPTPTTITMCISGCKNTQDVDNKELTKNENSHSDDIGKFVNLCEKGVIYDYLESMAGLTGMSRQQVKEMFYREVFFGHNRAVTEFTKQFANEFPKVMDSIRQTKKKDYRELACLMQRRESDVMIHGVCRRLDVDYPHIPVITIHDSILTTPEHVGCVKDVMLEEFARVGLHPKLRFEYPGEGLALAA